MSQKVHYYFKLFGNIKDEAEVHFAELELNSLFGGVDRVRNFSDELTKTPLKYFSDGKGKSLDETEVKVPDVLTYELPYGKWQGFHGVKDKTEDITNLVKRLAYTREIILVTLADNPEKLLEKIFPDGEVEKNVQIFKNNGRTLIRLITHQYFIENSQYISKVSKNEEHIDDNVERLLSFPVKDFYRIPSSSTARVGKRLKDYFAIREEPSLYLTHYMHPYKGKFHPKMVRALLNYVYPKKDGLVMDNYAGCGTLLVEASWMGLDSLGLEVNPLSVLMSNVKCDSLTIPPKKLKEEIERFGDAVETAVEAYKTKEEGQELIDEPKYNFEKVKEEKAEVPEKVKEKRFKNHSSVDSILVAKEAFENYQPNLDDQEEEEKIRQFLHLGLSGTISDMSRRKSGRFSESLKERLWDLYLRIYLFHKLNDVLKFDIGESETYTGDTRDMKNTCKDWDGERIEIEDSSIDGIVNSPPYSTALDYIKNDLPQLTLLNLPNSTIEEIGENMVGIPKMKYYTDDLKEEIKSNHEDFTNLPDYAQERIKWLLDGGRKRKALRTYRFFKDIYKSLQEMDRVMKKGTKCAIVIGNNNYKVNGEYGEVKNDEVILKIAEKEELNLKPDEKVNEILKENSDPDKVKPGKIWRFLQKTRKGNIRYESIIVLEKK